MGATIKDIAKRAGVSYPAAAMALRPDRESYRHVSPELRKKILAIAEELGYVRNALAASVAGKDGKLKAVAYIGSIIHYYSSAVCDGADIALHDSGYSLRLITVRTGGDACVEAAARECREHRLSGAIVRDCNSPAQLKLLKSVLDLDDIKLVVVDKLFDFPGVNVATTDEAAGMALAVRHLASSGHSRIGLLGHAAVPGSQIHQRESGYFKTMNELALEPLPLCELPFLWDDSWMEKISRYLRELKPTAVCCNSDFVAMRALQFAHSAGISVPRDLSIVGFCGLPMAEYAAPPLTTVVQPFRQIGVEAVKLLMESIANPSLEPRTVLLPPSLVIRGSTAPLA